MKKFLLSFLVIAAMAMPFAAYAQMAPEELQQLLQMLPEKIQQELQRLQPHEQQQLLQGLRSMPPNEQQQLLQKAQIMPGIVLRQLLKKELEEQKEEQQMSMQMQQSQPQGQETPQDQSQTQDGDDSLYMFIPPNIAAKVPNIDHIPYFFSHITPLEGGQVTVTETIQIVRKNKAGNDFIRMLPHVIKNRHEQIFTNDITVFRVERNGKELASENYNFRKINSGYELVVPNHGDNSQGLHRYVISYILRDGIRVSNQTAEFSWSVLGNGFDIPVHRAGAVVVLPPNTSVTHQSAALGDPKDPFKRVETFTDEEGSIGFAAKEPLESGDVFLLNADFPSDILGGTGTKTSFWSMDKYQLVISVIGLLLLAGYYAYTWLTISKHLPKDEVARISKQMARGKIKAATMRYVYRHKLDTRGMCAAIVGLATRGTISISLSVARNKFVLSRKVVNMKKLHKLDRIFVNGLFGPSGVECEISPANSKRLTNLYYRFGRFIFHDYRMKFLWFNQGYFWAGFMIILMSVTTNAIINDNIIKVCSSMLVTMLAMAVSILCTENIRNKTIAAPARWAYSCLLALSLSCFIGGILWHTYETSGPNTVLFTMMTAVLWVAYEMLNHPNKLGLFLSSAAAGYREYLSKNIANTFKITRDDVKTRLLEKHLSSAIALEIDAEFMQQYLMGVTENYKQNWNLVGATDEYKPTWLNSDIPIDKDFITNLCREIDTRLKLSGM